MDTDAPHAAPRASTSALTLRLDGHRRRAPRSLGGTLVLLEIALEVPALLERRPGRDAGERALALASVVDRFDGFVQRSGGRCLGVGDLCLLACWSAAEQGSEAANHALSAARRLAGDLHLAGVDGSLRAALVVGSGLTGRFGGVAGRWCELASGGVASMLGPALGLCSDGELIHSEQLHFGQDLDHPSQRHPDGLAALPLLPSGASSEPPPEPRELALSPCSMVAIEICGVSSARGDYPERLHGAARSLQRSARLHGGAVLELRHDHRGLFALVRFDASGGRTGRAALRALRFGQELARALGEQGLDAPAGITTGDAWFWKVGSRWAAIGHPVARAVELAKATASEQLCDLSTATLTRTRARLEPHRGGAQRPVEPCFVVEHVEASRGSRWPGASGTVGRREQLARLDQVVGEFLAGTTGVLLIEGEQGMGKSRMADELVARLRDERCRVLVSYGMPGATAAPLAPWRSLLLQLLGLDEPVSAQACRERLEQRLGTELTELDLEGLAGLLPVRDGADLRPLPGAARALDTAVSLILALQQDQPLLVVLEDGQWLDSASWRLARQLALHADELLLVVTLRTDTHELSLEAQRLAALPETTVMVLRGIVSERLGRLVQHELGFTGLDRALLARLGAATGGNPRLCLEWLRLAMDEGSLRVADGRVVEAPNADDPSLDHIGGLRSLLARRVALLDASVLRTLAVCDAVGGVFESELVAHVHPDAPGSTRVSADLERLATVGLVQPAPGRPDRAWTVTHASALEGVRDSVGPDERAALHGAVASWYEQQLDDLSDLYPTLARHWIEAGRIDNALSYLELAGAQAMRSAAMPEAVKHYRRALKLAGDAGALEGTGLLRRAHWERALGDARYACGELERCSVHFDRALALLELPVPKGRWRRALYAGWQLALQAVHRLLPMGRIERPAEQHPRLLEASHAAERLAERYYYSADAISLACCSVLSANLADRTGRYARNARPYASMSYLIGLVGLHGLSERVYERAVEIGHGAPDPTGLAVAHFTRATYHLGLAQWDRAHAVAAQGVEAAEDASAWQEAGVARTLAAVCHFMQGSFAKAEACQGELMAAARERYNAQHEAWALYGVGECQNNLGRLAEAARSVQRALAVLRNLEDYPSRLICHGVLASVHARAGELERAREAADLSLSLLERVPFPFVLPTVEGCTGVAEVYLILLAANAPDQPGRRELLERAGKAVRSLRRFSRAFPVTRPRYLLAAGRLAALRGQPARSQSLLRRAERLAAALGLPFELAQARAGLAACAGVSASEAAELRQHALEEFERLGCAWHLQQLQDQQGQSQ